MNILFLFRKKRMNQCFLKDHNHKLFWDTACRFENIWLTPSWIHRVQPSQFHIYNWVQVHSRPLVDALLPTIVGSTLFWPCFCWLTLLLIVCIILVLKEKYESLMQTLEYPLSDRKVTFDPIIRIDPYI